MEAGSHEAGSPKHARIKTNTHVCTRDKIYRPPGPVKIEGLTAQKVRIRM